MDITGMRRSTRLLAAVSPLVIGAGFAPMASEADSWGFAVSWFHTATLSIDKEVCPEGKNPNSEALHRRVLVEQGYSPAAAAKAIEKLEDLNADPAEKAAIGTALRVRGKDKAGKPVPVYNYPMSVADPGIKTVRGPYAYGFDLDGDVSTGGFSDVETREPGIDNQLYRAVGCLAEFDRKLPDRPFYESLMWTTVLGTMPAWLMTVQAPDLRRDGPVTVIFDRATRPLQLDASSEVMAGASYAMDAGPRSHHVAKGELKAGILTIESTDLVLEGEAPLLSELNLKQAQLRLQFGRDFALKGYIGGYLPWDSFYQMYAAIAPALEGTGTDLPGMYYALRKMADAEPDPVTGEKRRISSAFRLEAVPAFIVSLDGAVVATPPAYAVPSIAGNDPR